MSDLDTSLIFENPDAASAAGACKFHEPDPQLPSVRPKITSKNHEATAKNVVDTEGTESLLQTELRAVRRQCSDMKNCMKNMTENSSYADPQIQQEIEGLRVEMLQMLMKTVPVSNNESADSLIKEKRKMKVKKKHIKSENSPDTTSDSSEVSKTSLSLKKTQKKRRGIFDKNEASLLEVLTKIDNRRAPMPAQFSLESGRSFGGFLTSFEEYCHNTFKGSRSLWTSELGQFLDGSIKQFYMVLNGPDEDYDEIKKKLIRWSDDSRENVQRAKRRKFEKIRMNQGESLRLYGARMEREFKLAHPKKRISSSRTLQEKFLETTPSSFRKQVASVKSFLSLQGNKLAWDSLMRVASAYDLENNGNRTEVDSDADQEVTEVWAATVPQPPTTRYTRPVSFARSSSVPRRTSLQQSYNHDNLPARSVNFTDSRQKSGSYRDLDSGINSNSKSCFYCKRPGHFKRDCWRLHTKCLACGSDLHRIADCPRRRSLQNNSWKPQRSLNAGKYPSGTSYASENEKALAGLGTSHRQS